MDTVLSVDEIHEEFYISFTMRTQWYDSRLKFNNLKQQLQDTKKKLEAAEKQVDEKTQIVNDLENKLKVDMINSSASLEGQCLLLLCNLYLWLTLHGNLLISLI